MSISREQVVFGVPVYPSFGDFRPIVINISVLYFREMEVVITLKIDQQAVYVGTEI